MTKQTENGVSIPEINFQNLQRQEVFTHVASDLQGYCDQNNLTVNIQGNRYAMVEAWQFAGAMIGLFPRITSVENIGKENVFKYRAVCKIYDTKGVFITRAEAICSNEEKKKKYFDEYAIASMAQTRATGKAFRVLLGWIFKASGFESTPAEEMDEMTPDPKEQSYRTKYEHIYREYKQTMLKAIAACGTADDVTKLMKAADTMKMEAQVLDAGKKKYYQLLEEIKGDEG